MERRFRVRLDELLSDAEVRPSLLRGALPRLEAFLRPFVEPLRTPEQQTNARQYIQGLLSDLDGKDVESIAYLHDRERQGLQKFIGQAEWDHQPLVAELVRQVATELAEADGVLVFDPSAFPKKGTASVGVQRQWCGRLGKVENCQVGVFLGYVSDDEHALVDFRLYLPREWAKDRKRRQKAGVPKEVKYQTRHELALEMLQRHGGALPHGWVAGDDEMGRPAWFRQRLAHDRAQGPLPARAGVVRGAAGGGLDEAHRSRRRERSAGGRGRRPAGGVEGRPAGRRVRGDPGGGAVHGRRCAQARLPPLQRRTRHAARGARAGGQGVAPDRGVPEAVQERGGAGGVPGAELARVAPPHGAVAGRDVVPRGGGPPGEKRRSRP